MPTSILSTKLYIPPTRPNAVIRPRLMTRLNQSLHQKLTLVSASAGFGKTTLMSQWFAGLDQSVAWLSLDEGDNDSTRFLMYLVASLQTIAPTFGKTVMAVLQSPQPPAIETILTTLVNEIALIQEPFILMLDDYHVLDSTAIDHALTFLVDHMPPQMHLVIATREDPNLPLARLRATGQLTEIRTIDLRFNIEESTGFFNQVMDLDLSAQDIEALETRTEGWIAGLQLAGISMQSHQDVPAFIQSFTGKHHYILDYLLEEVLHQQPDALQTFLLQTSILDRLCGSLCDAVMDSPTANSQTVLESIQQANLFLIPLDNERLWYRYHHLFADLLRQRLQDYLTHHHHDADQQLAQLHIRASQWFEDHDLDIEAFHHATLAHDIVRAERLIAGREMPLIFRGVVFPVLKWLESLPTSTLDEHPSLWVWFAWALMSLGRSTGIEEKLLSAEHVIENVHDEEKLRDLIGQIATIRSMISIPHYKIERMITQSQKALDYLHPDNLPVRTATIWAQGYAYHLRGDRAIASEAYARVIPITKATGNFMFQIASLAGLGILQQQDNKLHRAYESFEQVSQLAGQPPLPHANGAFLGMARIAYQWNDIELAQEYGELCIELGRQIPSLDMPAVGQLFLAKIKMLHGDFSGAMTLIDKAEQFVRDRHFDHRLSDVISTRVQCLLHQKDYETALQLVDDHDIPQSRARVLMAQGDTATALTLLEPLREQAQAKQWVNDELQIMILQAVAYEQHGDREIALQILHDALVIAQPEGFIRIFVDEGIPMAHLLSVASTQGMMAEYVALLLSAFHDQGGLDESPSQLLIEPLTSRELEVLRLIVAGYSNPDIAKKLIIAVTTVKTHVKNIYGKLQVTNRVEAVTRATDLKLI